jgi:Cdc6-like AAA superfamily ATPase
MQNESRQLLEKVFSPTSPIKEKDFFFGRIQQLTKIANAINEKGQHAILYGERGVGKTSLANIMCTSLTNVYPTKVTCNRNDTFKSLWERALTQVHFSQTTQSIGFSPIAKKQLINLGKSVTSKENITPADIEQIVGPFQQFHFLFIFDEFDNLTVNKARSAFSDLIKSLSDNLGNITIVIVGIADNVENLIANHQSLERCLMQIKMPRMSDEELNEIITKGFETLQIKIPDAIKQKIITFSSGFPHYTHLLCKFCAKEAIKREADEVSTEDLNEAIRLSVENTSEQSRIAYKKAILSSSSKSQWKEVLFACALANTDEFDRFSTNDVQKEFSTLTNKTRASITYNLGKFCSEERGNILEKVGAGRNFKYRFLNPMIKAFIRLNMN